MTAATDKRIRSKVAEGVMTLTVARPDARNALDIATIQELKTIVAELPVLGEVSVLVIESDGDDAFIAGGDLREFAMLKGEPAGWALSETMAEVTSAIEALPQVVIAAINGDAYGGGVELVLACDLRVIQEASHLHFAQGRFGLTTAWGGTARLVRLVGYSRALDILLGTQTLDASACHNLGLANHVFAAEKFEAETRALAHKTAALGRELVWSIKRVARAAVTGPMDDALLIERQAFSKLWASQAHEAKVRTFIDAKAWEPNE